MEQRIVTFDNELSIEAYQFKGIKQKFPNHFHEFYVLGFIENGRRFLSCKQKEYIVKKGDLLLINPYDNHFCEQIGEELLDYRSIHIAPDIMGKLAKQITDKEGQPIFSQNVVPDYQEIDLLKELHSLINDKEEQLKKAECLYLFLEEILSNYTSNISEKRTVDTHGIEPICQYIEEHYAEQITLDALSELSQKNQFTLIRQFTKLKGVSPHQYLTTVRISNAKKMLEQGALPSEVAVSSGFSDQSHFSRCFKNVIGVTPGRYMMIFKREGSNGSAG